MCCRTAKSLDTVGFFTHTADDMLALWEAMGHLSGRDETLTFGVPDPMPEVDADMAAAMQQAFDTLRRGGIATKPIDIAGLLKTLDATTNDIAFYEGSRFHEQRWKEHGERLLDLAALVEKGLQMTAQQDKRAHCGKSATHGAGCGKLLAGTRPSSWCRPRQARHRGGSLTAGNPRINAAVDRAGSPPPSRFRCGSPGCRWDCS